MKTTLLVILAVLLLLVPIAVFTVGSRVANAAGVSGYRSAVASRTELTAQQQEDLDESFEQMIELRKETVQTMVQDGRLTEEEGRQALDRLDEMAEYHSENESTMFYGTSGFRCEMDGDEPADWEDGYYGRGMMGGYYGRDWQE